MGPDLETMTADRETHGTFLVLGIDALTWSVITANLALGKLPNFKRLLELGKSSVITLQEKPISASVWCSMFSGTLPKEHQHESYVKNEEIVKREDINVDFIWDVLAKRGKTVKALNVPFVVPPYNYNVNFKPIGFGLPTTEQEWGEELDRVTATTKKLIEEQPAPDVLIAVYTSLDRIQHFHWG
jgi:predicted AlkP superfamily phosphohydrolase/phosphomutase